MFLDVGHEFKDGDAAGDGGDGRGLVELKAAVERCARHPRAVAVCGLFVARVPDRWEEGIDLIRRALCVDKVHADNWSRLGDALSLRSSTIERAANAYLKALDLRSGHAPSLRGIGALLIRGFRPDERTKHSILNATNRPDRGAWETFLLGSVGKLVDPVDLSRCHEGTI